jgi:hypothetical protein
MLLYQVMVPIFQNDGTAYSKHIRNLSTQYHTNSNHGNSVKQPAAIVL